MKEYLIQLHPHVCINLVLDQDMFLLPPSPLAMSSNQSLLHSNLLLRKPYKNNSSNTFAHTLSYSNSCPHVLLKYPAPSYVPTSWNLLRCCIWILLAFPSHNHEMTWVQIQESTCTQKWPHCMGHNNYLYHNSNTYRITLVS